MSAGEGFSQSHAALCKANHVRTARRQIKAELAAGERSLVDLFLDPPEEVLTAKAFDVLTWMPGIGPTRARKLLMHPYTVASPQVRVGHLSMSTRQKLCGRLEAAVPVRIAA